MHTATATGAIIKVVDPVGTQAMDKAADATTATTAGTIAITKVGVTMATLVAIAMVTMVDTMVDGIM